MSRVFQLCSKPWDQGSDIMSGSFHLVSFTCWRLTSVLTTSNSQSLRRVHINLDDHVVLG
jgi:hypothetical protein